jgi:hypothetical protein
MGDWWDDLMNTFSTSQRFAAPSHRFFQGEGERERERETCCQLPLSSESPSDI